MKTSEWTFDPSNKPAKSTHISVDLETFLISACVQAPTVVAMGFSVDMGKVQVVAANDPAFDRTVEALFSDPNAVLFGHNFGKFDVPCLLAHGARWGLDHWPALIFKALQEDRVTDTSLRETLIHIAEANPKHSKRKFNLGACAAHHRLPTQPNKEDPFRLKWGELADLSVSQYPAEATKYLVEDVQACGELYRTQSRHAGWLADQFRQTRAAVALGLISAWGFATDRGTVEYVIAETQKDLDLAQKVAREAGLIREDGTRDIKAASARQVQAYAALGKPAPVGELTEMMATYNKPANVKLDDEACEESGDYTMQMYARASQTQGLLSKIERLRHPVIQASFVPLLETGRTGCTQGAQPKIGEAPTAHGFQMQNPSRAVMHLCRECVGVGCPACNGKGEYEDTGVRECFVARPGHVLLDIDYRMAELCALGQIERWWFGSSTLGDVLNDPTRDVHVELAAKILTDLPLEEVWSWKKSDPKRFKALRQAGKVLSFGPPGGLGAARLVDFAKESGVTMTEDEAREYLAAIKRVYPERRAYLDRISNWCQTDDRKYRFTQPYSGRVRGGLTYANGANTGFQGLAADFAKEGMWRVAVHQYVLTDSPLYGSRTVNMVHDQLLVEAAEAGYREAAGELQRQWVSAANYVCPDNIMIAEPAACRRWSKSGGDPVYDVEGRLEIYEDQA